MALIRHEGGIGEYVMVPTALARDPWLTPEAKELYLFASTIHDDDDFTTHYIERVLGMPKEVILITLDELNNHGYTRFVVIGDES